MSEDTMIKLIETNKLITYSDIINFFMLYNKTNQKFISKIQNLFFSEKQKSVYTKEMVRVINHALLVIIAIRCNKMYLS